MGVDLGTSFARHSSIERTPANLEFLSSSLILTGISFHFLDLEPFHLLPERLATGVR
jgi:hypothetical protein